MTAQPSVANMLGLASILKLKPIEVCFAARLGRLPQPIGRDELGFLVFDIAEAERRLIVSEVPA